MTYKSLQEILTDAIADFEAHGFDNEERLIYWESQIREALARQVRGAAAMDDLLKAQLKTVFDRLVRRGSAMQYHKGVSRFTLANIQPRLHAELQKRIVASAQLIKLNRDDMIQKTMRRFSGWATSVPKGGTGQTDTRKLKKEISKPLQQLPFVQRRVLIDQGHKLNSNINAVVAIEGGAIAAKWFSHWRQSGYDYREDHKERDGHIYLIRDSWAHKAGFVKPNKDGFSDAITQPAEEVFCRCKFVYLYHLRQLPDDMITVKGKEALKKVRAA